MQGSVQVLVSSLVVKLGGIAAYQLVDAFDKELEVFTAWTVF